MKTEVRIQMAKDHIAMLDSKIFNDRRALAYRALVAHLENGVPSLGLVLDLAEECDVRRSRVFVGLKSNS